MNNRFLIDYDNPDAGIGHSMGFINRSIKIASRNKLLFSYSESQLLKSSHSSRAWQLKQLFRMLRGSRRYETHNIGNDLNRMLNLKALLPPRVEVERKIQTGEIKVIDLPKFEIHIPSNHHEDDQIYQATDEFIRSHTGSNVAFRIRNNRSGDYEYAHTRKWLINSYNKARENFPIALSYDPNKLNIAAHIRRGDLLPGRQFADLSSRMLPDAWYLEILDAILKHSEKPIAIHIFSEGKDGQYRSENGSPFSWKEHFKQTPHEIHEHIDSDFLSAFHHLMHADILVGSKSGMSHLAGMLSTQSKLMPKMWHSYRGSNQLMELPDAQSSLNKKSIAAFVKQWL
jgi:hypothetical protein